MGRFIVCSGTASVPPGEVVDSFPGIGGTRNYSEIRGVCTYKCDVGYSRLLNACVANNYTITFDANGGGGTQTSVTATYNNPMPVITIGVNRIGYIFNGYYDATSGGNLYYNPDGSSATIWDKAANTTLYAQWNINYCDFGGSDLFDGGCFFSP
ncbi:hypothetical protein EOM39_05810 [Candidatus Gracilibacteria bacterium]|nr:hypothetical protein [Candidatus Gracilibacteria bacterium]